LVGQSRDWRSPLHTTAQVSVTFDNNAIDSLLEEHKFDVLHYHEPWVPIVSRQILTRSNTVNIATFHAKLPETMMTKTIEKVITPYSKSILKYINAFTAVSDAAAEYIRSLTDEDVLLIPNGIDIKKFSLDQPPKRESQTILYVGRLEKRKVSDTYYRPLMYCSKLCQMLS
jgi:phosphatidylinositol alpha-mannosyltransferase